MRSKSTPYHHGNLRSALIEAGHSELEEAGCEGFTLRSCARRAGVSHAAPATFFPSITAFFTAIASESFADLARQMEKATMAIDGPLERMVAMGLAYAKFAFRQPEHFRLMWRNERLYLDDADLRAASGAAFAHPVSCIARLYDHPDPMSDRSLAPRVIALWSMIHGATELTLSGQLDASGLGPHVTIVQAVLPAMITEHFGKTVT
jgi:AcrR family transcriptional regulator